MSSGRRTSALPFLGRTVLITGASAGIGAACARQFAAAGANLVLVARGKVELERFASTLAGKVAVVAGDISDDRVQEDAVARAIEVFGGLHVLVNNAGLNTRGP